MNYPPCHQWPEMSKNYLIKSFQAINKSPKTKIDLNAEAQDFKKKFYGIFTPRKKFEKKYVAQIHNCFLTKKFTFDRVSRDEIRQIDLYFQKYSKHKDSIIRFLKENKKEISRIFNLRIPLKF